MDKLTFQCAAVSDTTRFRQLVGAVRVTPYEEGIPRTLASVPGLELS